ncbi:Protein mlo2 [Stylosanthes scabra]|uniref:MLO-like protein n=1 Tax=Stylosanthes scabra TaxID=79078 RepID=A0ABU6TG82_9FABA|nr:Protein mlo2 [Stylosanthes scabra]
MKREKGETLYFRNGSMKVTKHVFFEWGKFHMNYTQLLRMGKMDLVGTWLWLKRNNKNALYEALEKVKGELILLGFISLLLTVFQNPISRICISKSAASTWHPCAVPKKSKYADDDDDDSNGRKLLGHISRRILATKGYDKCAEKGKVAFVSAYGIHQLHIFIFVLAIFHILQCIITLALGRTKMRRWKKWEDETKTIEYEFYNDPERFRFARDTTFGRRHLSAWSRTSISLWMVSFFRQFYGSVTKADYVALRHGFIMAHLAPGSEAKFDFQKYIHRSLEEDFKIVVGISPIIWFVAVLFLLTNTHGWYSYYWLPFVPLTIILLVGAKLQAIITKMGLRIQERGEVVQGSPLVEPGDELFWFNRPALLLFLIHLVLFQNAFQLAFFSWSTYEFTIRSCFHKTTVDVILRISIGVVIQVLCSYVTLPLYALVTQMGSSMKTTVFNDRVATALKNWHHSARKHVKDSKHGEGNSSVTPTHGLSPVHLLYRHTAGHSDSLQTSPRLSNYENEQWQQVQGSLSSTSNHGGGGDDETDIQVLEQPLPVTNSVQHEININLSEFSFANRQNSSRD